MTEQLAADELKRLREEQEDAYAEVEEVLLEAELKQRLAAEELAGKSVTYFEADNVTQEGGENITLHSPEKQHLVIPDYNPVETMLTKMEAWLIQQPEWAIILAAPRATRRQAIHLMSKRILTIPNRYGRP